jgi:hypothetical protein
MLLVMNLEIIFCIVSVWCVVSNSSLAVPVRRAIRRWFIRSNRLRAHQSGQDSSVSTLGRTRQMEIRIGETPVMTETAACVEL